jgi:hypothetical protein
MELLMLGRKLIAERIQFWWYNLLRSMSGAEDLPFLMALWLEGIALHRCHDVEIEESHLLRNS